MRALPLRVKVALWSALMAGGAMGLALFGIRYFLQYELQETLDWRLDRVASEIFWNLDQRPGGPAEVRTIIADDLMPPSAASHLIEIIGEKKQTTSRGPNQLIVLTDVNDSKDNARKIRARLGACRADPFTREPCLEI